MANHEKLIVGISALPSRGSQELIDEAARILGREHYDVLRALASQVDQAARQDERERAARVCEEAANDDLGSAALACAERIRALSSSPIEGKEK